MTGTAVGSPFGQRLRLWRTQRGLSQLALANSAGTTPRHLSFLETGRSRPQRDIVLRLGDALALPLREINAMLQAAGLAPSFAHQPWLAADLAPFRAAIDTMLAAHLPYPALVLDSHTTVLQVNAACDRLFGPGMVGGNFVRDVLSSPHTAGRVDNWPQVAWAGLHRLRAAAARNPFDVELADLVDAAEAAVAGLDAPPGAPSDQLTVCPRFLIDGTLVGTIVVTARFDAPAEVTLDELRIELIYPADEAADRYFRTAATIPGG